MERVNVAGNWHESVPLVRVGGVWKDVDSGWVNVGGVWKAFKKPYVAKGGTVNLTSANFTGGDGVVYERRSFVRSGNGPAKGTPGSATQGSISNQTVVIDGVTYEVRGIETGSDNVAGANTAWKWISIQFFGNVDPMKLARDTIIGGKRAIFVGTGGGYNASADHTYLTYLMDSAYTFPVNTALSFKF